MAAKVDICDIEDVSSPDKKRRRQYEHEIMIEMHEEEIKQAAEQTEVALSVLKKLQGLVVKLSTLLFVPSTDVDDSEKKKQKDNGSNQLSYKNVSSDTIETALSLGQGTIPLLARIRRHHRHVCTLTTQANQLLDDVKLRRRYLIQQWLDSKAQVTYLRNQTRHELSMYQIPKFKAVLPQLCSKEEYEKSELFALSKADAFPEIYYLNWLRLDLTCREEEHKQIEEVKNLRQTEEEKLKLLKKRETELTARILPIEKELTKLLATLVPNNTTLTSSISMRVHALPDQAYNLPEPLFRIFMQLSTYKTLNYDTFIDVGLTAARSTDKTTTSPSLNPKCSLFQVAPIRVQVVIDKPSDSRLPPTTYLRAAPLFPLTLRFFFFPQLHIVSAMCQFPKVIGTDVTFLADLCFPNDGGTVSPNPLHHVVSSVSQLYSEELSLSALTDSTESLDFVPDSEQDIPKWIASQLLDLQLGRAYRWCQSFAGLYASQQYNNVTTALTEARETISIIKEKTPLVSAAQFVSNFRSRVILRAWTLHLEESLKHQPNEIPPVGTSLPTSFQALSSEVAACFSSFVSISAKDFISNGASLKGVMNVQDRDIRFIKGTINLTYSQYFVYVAIPLDARNAEFTFQLAELRSNNLKNKFSLNVFDDSEKDLFQFFIIYNNEKKHVFPSNEREKLIHEAQLLRPTLSLDLAAKALVEELYPATSWLYTDAKKLTHFSDPRLTEIQDYINYRLPGTYGGRVGEHKESILIIQLIALVQKLSLLEQDLCSV